MSRPTEEDVKQFVDGVIGVELTFPTPNHEYAVKAFYEKFFPDSAFEDGVTLHPGEQFCLNEDGGAVINRADGNVEKFYPEDGWVSIKIDV